MSEFPYWSKHSQKVSIWSVLIHSVAKTFKSDPIQIKLLKAFPGLKKNQLLGIDVSGIFVGEKI